jgi:exosortase/archaeosortase family protein
LAYLYAALLPRPRWMKLALIASVAPVAMAANALRLTVTAMVWKQVASVQGRDLLHETAGWLMVPLAAALLYAVVRYLDRTTVPVEVVEPTQLLRRRGSGPSLDSSSSVQCGGRGGVWKPDALARDTPVPTLAYASGFQELMNDPGEQDVPTTRKHRND